MRISTAPQLLPMGNLAAKIDAGQVPADLCLDGHDGSTVPLGPKASAQGRLRYLGGVVPPLVLFSATGALLGAAMGQASSLTPMGPIINHSLLIGTAIGITGGTALALDLGKRLRGKVTVELDGQSEQKNWMGNPQLRERSPQELKVMLTALDRLGENISPAALSLSGPADAAAAAALTSSKDSLRQLAEQRRLLGDLGAQSRYGNPALQLIDGVGARELLARNRQVYVISGEKVEDTAHNLRTAAYSATKNHLDVETFDYLERKFQYQLHTISGAADLQAVEPAPGVPEGLNGVYREGGEYSQPVARHSEQGQRQFLEKGQERNSLQINDSTVVAAAPKPLNGAAAKLAELSRHSTKAYAILGGIVGAVGAGLIGQQPVVGIAIGTTVGHLVGRASITADEDSKIPAVVRAGLMTVTAAAGVGLALHGGLDSSLAAGAVGGFLLGAYASSRSQSESREIFSRLGFIGGAGLGIAAAVSGAHWLLYPLAGVAGLSGLVLGQAVGRH